MVNYTREVLGGVITAEKYGAGAGTRWGELHELNRDLIRNPSLIYIGQTLKLPAA